MRWLDGITNSMDMRLSKLEEYWRTEKPGVLQSMGSQRVGHDLVTEQPESTNIEITTSSNSNNDCLIVIAALHNNLT